MPVFFVTFIAMLAFAANSILCRLALQDTDIDPASFTLIRMVSAALVLSLIVMMKQRQQSVYQAGSWFSAIALLTYAGAFSFAYIELTAATGALLLFGSVQLTMLGWALFSGERFNHWQWLGIVLAITGLVVLFLPGLAQPSVAHACLMVLAGLAWGIYSLRGRGKGDATAVTGGNFIRTIPLSLILVVLFAESQNLDLLGVCYALLSGGIASGMGYALWYSILPKLATNQAGIIQLSVPVLTTFIGAWLLAEAINLQIVLASLTILGGIALVISKKQAA